MSARRGPARGDWRPSTRRGSPRASQLERHLILCEGSQTEPRYFEGLKRALGSTNGSRLSVEVRGTGLHTLGLLMEAERRCREAVNPFAHAWLVYDKDDFPEDEFDRVAKRCAVRRGETVFHAIWSNPCFELWFLLHFGYTSAPLQAAECQARLEKLFLKRLHMKYEKNLDGVFSLLAPWREDAARHASRLEGHHGDAGCTRPAQMNPATRMVELHAAFEGYLTERMA